MSEQPTYYTLKKPLKAYLENHSKDEQSYCLILDGSPDFNFMDKDDFEDLFVSLDIETLRQQICEEIREYAESMLPDYGVPIHKRERLDATVDAVLGVVGITKETE